MGRPQFARCGLHGRVAPPGCLLGDHLFAGMRVWLCAGDGLGMLPGSALGFVKRTGDREHVALPDALPRLLIRSRVTRVPGAKNCSFYKMLFDFRTRFLLLAFFAPATAARDGEHQILIDRGDSLSSKWVLTLGTEYPGASGALALSNDGQSLNVSFDLLDGGRYVGATCPVPS